jgi:hypothetical protein
VKYSFLPADEGGRKTGPPAQGYRSDFMYAEDKAENGLWMIHPEFLDESGSPILDKTIRVPNSGIAKMWILSEHLVNMHKSRIRIGQKGYFMEGPNKTAKCEVIDVVALK